MLSFFRVVIRILDHIFLEIPIGSGFGVNFSSSEVPLLQSNIIPRPFSFSWEAYDSLKQEESGRGLGEVDRMRQVWRAAPKFNGLMNCLIDRIKSEQICAAEDAKEHVLISCAAT